MDPDVLFFLQIFAASAVGGFVGEFFTRAHDIDRVNGRKFAANILVKVFLGVVISYLLYLVSNARAVYPLLGALLAFQKEEYLSGTARKILEKLTGIRGINKHE